MLAEVEKQFIQTARDKKSAGLVYEIEIKRAESLHSNLSKRLLQQQFTPAVATTDARTKPESIQGGIQP